MNPLDFLTKGISKFLEAALDEGFALPLHLAAVSVNGSLTFIRYTDGAGQELQAYVLAEYFDGFGFNCPINAMLTDSRGQAARMLIRGPEEPEFFWPHSLP